jgi:methylenetetrahydrofolate--tRNA-(uracil-5-)-methyltransferase
VSLFIDSFMQDKPIPFPPLDTALGALLNAITVEKEVFQPTNINWGLFPPLTNIKKIDKKAAHVNRAQSAFEAYFQGNFT